MKGNSYIHIPYDVALSMEHKISMLLSYGRLGAEEAQAIAPFYNCVNARNSPSEYVPSCLRNGCADDLCVKNRRCEQMVKFMADAKPTGTASPLPVHLL